MKFAHIADVHVGGWREERMREVGYEYFSKAIDEIIESEVDFLLIAGDLFNTSFPAIDALKLVVQKLTMLKKKDIPVYYIAGSHDFSPSGKTMLDVLEEAGLAKDVMRGKVDDSGKLHLKFTVDEKTGAKITGIIGKRGMLDKKYYESLERENLEKEDGFKIFMFHTTINELKPKNLEKMEGAPVSLLPKNFNYYAGGHVHIVRAVDIEGYKNVVYPGPIFPNSFSEIEELHGGSYYLYEDGKVTLKKLGSRKHVGIVIDCDDRDPEAIEKELMDKIDSLDVSDSIVTIRLKGNIKDGKLTDIDMKTAFEKLYSKEAYFVMRNTNAVKFSGFEEIKIRTDSIENIEEEIISENAGQVKVDGLSVDKEKAVIKDIISALHTEKDEGEKVKDYEERVVREMDELLKI